jgi:hypothetical protein
MWELGAERWDSGLKPRALVSLFLVLLLGRGVDVGVHLDFVVRLRGDVVNIDRGIVLEIIDSIDPAARPLLDGTAWLVVLLIALLTPQPLRRRRRTEIGAAVASARTRGAAGSPESTRPGGEATRSGAAEPARSARTRSAEPTTWPGTAEASRPWPARRAILTGACLAYGKTPSLKGLRVEFLDDVFGDRTIREFHEREAAGTTGLAIDRHDDMGRFCDGGKVGSKVRFTRSVRQVPDEQTDCQCSLVKSAACAAASDSIPVG